jgi:restriction system protein
MAVPMKKQLYRPILEIAAESGTAVSPKQLRESLALRFHLTDADLQDRSSSGALRFTDRASFGTFDLKSAGLMCSPSRGLYQITGEGREFLATLPAAQLLIAESELKRLAVERRQREGGREDATTVESSPDVDITPDELMAAGYHQLQSKLADNLLESFKDISPYGFERLVLDLLVKMGYGTGQAVGRSGDGGIDGVINQDPLGLEKVYVQAKRWAGQVGEPEIRNFSGSLDARGASKGVFITTSNFSASAQRTADTISAGNKFIRLIGGDELARLMIEHGVGVVTEFTYELKKLDENYFSEFADL